MIFNSLNFIFIFLPLISFLYYLSQKRYRNYILLILSLVFYAYLGIRYLVILFISIFINYFGTLLMSLNKDDKNKRKMWLILSIFSHIVLLGYFKYYDFIVSNLNHILSTELTLKNLVIPIGISFYTFKGISYLIANYKNVYMFEWNPMKMILYISFFPQISAGPITKFEDFYPQIITRVESLDRYENGIRRFVYGLSKKVIISNSFALVADNIFSLEINNINFGYAWLGILAYTVQIYYDFSGYSDMAIGLGEMFGFITKENFNYPYVSKSITEFWRRWHISLGTFFKDYIYIPLGGNRVSVSRHIINTFIIWFLTGIWHGSSWNFIIWGIYYGCVIIVEKYILKDVLKNAPGIVTHIYSILFIMIGWVFFRSSSFSYAINFLKIMFTFNIDKNSINILMSNFLGYKVEWIVAILFCTPIYKKLKIKFSNNWFLNIERVFIIILFVITLIYMIASTYNSFIYFQF